MGNSRSKKRKQEEQERKKREQEEKEKENERRRIYFMNLEIERQRIEQEKIRKRRIAEQGYGGRGSFYNLYTNSKSDLTKEKIDISQINNLPQKTSYNHKYLIYDELQKDRNSYLGAKSARDTKIIQKCQQAGYDFRAINSSGAEILLDEVFKNMNTSAYSSYRNNTRNENQKLKKIAYEVFDSIIMDSNSLNLETFYEKSTDTTFYDFTVISIKESEKPLVVKTKVLASYFSQLVGEDPMFLATFAKRWKKYNYIIDNSLEFKKEEIRKAIITFKSVGFMLNFIEFTSVKNLNEPYVNFKISEISNSYVGCHFNRENIIGLSSDAEFGTILHEIMHSLGFYHEHQRADRTRFLYFDSSQVILNKTNRVNVYVIDCPLIGPYDDESITNYHRITDYYGFKAINSNFKKRGTNLSKLDKQKLRFVYSNNHCTYDGFGSVHYPQSFYECITCWSENSCYGACIYCASRDHKGHNLKYHDYKQHLKDGGGFFCDCGVMKHKQACTRISTGMAYKSQAMYLCLTCFNVGKYKRNHNNSIPGVCYPCSLRCHKDHDVSFFNYSENFFCDCGLDDCKSICYLQDP